MKLIVPMLIMSSLFFSGCIHQIPQQPASQERSLQIKEAVSEIQAALSEVNTRLYERGLKLTSAELTTNIKMIKGSTENINIWVLKQSGSASDSSEDSIKITLKPTPPSAKINREPIHIILAKAIIDAIDGTSTSNTGDYPLKVEKLEVTLNLTSTYTNESSATSPKIEIVPLASLGIGASLTSSKTKGMILKMTFEKQ